MDLRREGKLRKVGATTYNEKRAIWFLNFIATKLAKNIKGIPPKITFAYMDLYEKGEIANIKIKRKDNDVDALASGDQIVFNRNFIKDKLYLLKENKYSIKDKVIGAGDIDFLRSIKKIANN